MWSGLKNCDGFVIDIQKGGERVGVAPEATLVRGSTHLLCPGIIAARRKAEFRSLLDFSPGMV